MVPTINGLHNLIRMPYGCGEQTMINFAPAIYIHDYLAIVEKLTPEIKIKSTQILKTGNSLYVNCLQFSLYFLNIRFLQNKRGSLPFSSKIRKHDI
jgi:hypothetical protein